MVRLKLGKNLAEIVQETNLETVIFELIEWAESRNRLLDLVWGAYDKNPGNSLIKDITYRLFCITKAQWEELCKLLSGISPGSLEVACQQSFKSEIVEIDSRLIELKKSNNFDKIQPILKENFIKKREKSPREIPAILEFVDSLSKMKDINDAVCNDLEKLALDIANQLNIKLELQQENLTPSQFVETKIVQPYLLISFEDQGSDLELKAELVIQENDSETILKQESIYIQEQKQGVKCAKSLKKIGEYVKQFIKRSDFKLKYYCYQNSKIKHKKSIIVELFLPVRYFLKPMETITLPMECPGLFAGESMKLCCQHPLTFRALDRFETYQNNPQYSERLENNWKEVNDFFKSQLPLTSAVIEKKFEHHGNNHQKWQILEQRLRDNQKIGINIVSPLKSIQETEDIMRAIIIAGIPIALWSINLKNTPKKLRQSFIQLLAFQGIKNLTHLLYCIEKLRGKAYNSENPNSLGYGLGFLCDNPYRIPSRFKEEEDDAFTFG